MKPVRTSKPYLLTHRPITVPSPPSVQLQTCKIHFFNWLRALQQTLRTHRSLEASCATLWWRWRWWLLFSFVLFLVMEHRWNETDRGKPKYSGKNLSQCHFVHNKSHMDWPQVRTRASAVGGRRLTAWAMARPLQKPFSSVWTVLTPHTCRAFLSSHHFNHLKTKHICFTIFYFFLMG
jgi:hypothetical protein